MSGSGKSYWSRKLEEQNFRRFPCDDLIAGKLFPELTERTSAIRFLGDWMGFPYRLDYEGRESKYLKAEIEVLAEIIEYLRGTRERQQRKDRYRLDRQCYLQWRRLSPKASAAHDHCPFGHPERNPGKNVESLPGPTAAGALERHVQEGPR